MYKSPTISDNELFNTLRDRAKMLQIALTFEPAVYVRGWPTASNRPYRLSVKGGYKGSFATLEAVTKKLRKIEA